MSDNNFFGRRFKDGKSYYYYRLNKILPIRKMLKWLAAKTPDKILNLFYLLCGMKITLLGNDLYNSSFVMFTNKINRKYLHKYLLSKVWGVIKVKINKWWLVRNFLIKFYEKEKNLEFIQGIGTCTVFKTHSG